MALSKLVDIVRTLRSPDGCPWDREQTFDSLITHIIEEAYELVEAIKTAHYDDMREELGDVLLHVVMIAEMAAEQSLFDLDDVINGVSDKMIRRHPHVFGDSKADTVDEVWQNWDEIKKGEKDQSLLASVPRSLPALMRAMKIQKKAAKVGFDWESPADALSKIDEEVAELRELVDSPSPSKDRLHHEAGDVLFSIVNVIRKLGINPEEALQHTNHVFTERVTEMERLAGERDQSLDAMSLTDMEVLYQEAKRRVDV